MCFQDDAKVAAPPPPPEVLDQAAPDKKTANKRQANTLAIGSKAYRQVNGLQTPQAPTRASGYPSPSV